MLSHLSQMLSGASTAVVLSFRIVLYCHEGIAEDFKFPFLRPFIHAWKLLMEGSVEDKREFRRPQ
jgi:hypothetical protein